jgi:hypothetical protein
MGRVEEMSFEELVQTLVELEHETVPLDLERTMARTKIDRRLMRLISADGTVGLEERRASVRVPGDLAVRLSTGGHAWEARIIDLGEGGLGVRLDEPPPERIDMVDVELLGELGSDQQPPQARAKISWRKRDGQGGQLGLKFIAQPEGHRRRMRRVVIEILRRMPG